MADPYRDIQKILQGLTVEQRLRAWVRAMRRAGGLSYPSAEADVWREVVEIERTTPQADRSAFAAARDKILAANAFLNELAEARNFEVQALLATTVAVLSMSLMVEERSVRSHRSEARSKPASKRARRRARPEEPAASHPRAALLRELAKLAGLLFGMEAPQVRHYWTEVFGPPPDGLAFHMDFDKSDADYAEALRRTLKPRVIAVLLLANAILRTKEYLGSLVRETCPAIEEFMLPPVDERISEASAIVETVGSTELAEGLELEGGLLAKPDVMRSLLNDPHRYILPLAVIRDYESRVWGPWGLPGRAFFDMPQWEPSIDVIRGYAELMGGESTGDEQVEDTDQEWQN